MRLRLKTKLVLAITALVCALVFSLSVLAIRQVLQMSLDDAYRSGESVAATVFSQARSDLEQAFGVRQSLEPMLSHLAQRHIVRQVFAHQLRGC